MFGGITVSKPGALWLTTFMFLYNIKFLTDKPSLIKLYFNPLFILIAHPYDSMGFNYIQASGHNSSSTILSLYFAFKCVYATLMRWIDNVSEQKREDKRENCDPNIIMSSWYIISEHKFWFKIYALLSAKQCRLINVPRNDKWLCYNL